MKPYTMPFGDTPEAAWLSGVLNECLRQDGGRVNVQMNLLYHKVKAEPEHAQFAIQFLAQEIDADRSKLTTWRMSLGSIMLAYQLYRHNEFGAPMDQYPPELAHFLGQHPVVTECLMYVSDRLGA